MFAHTWIFYWPSYNTVDEQKQLKTTHNCLMKLGYPWPLRRFSAAEKAPSTIASYLLISLTDQPTSKGLFHVFCPEIEASLFSSFTYETSAHKLYHDLNRLWYSRRSCLASTCICVSKASATLLQYGELYWYRAVNQLPHTNLFLSQEDSVRMNNWIGWKLRWISPALKQTRLNIIYLEGKH